MCQTNIKIRLTSVLDIAKLVRGEQEVSRLLHPEAIVLKHLAREDNMFCDIHRATIRDYDYPTYLSRQASSE